MEAKRKLLDTKLKLFYPDEQTEADPLFGHPADLWVGSLLDAAENSVAMELWVGLRLTKEEMLAEQKALLKTLRKADEYLSSLSHDLNIMRGVEADVRGCRDMIRSLVPRVEAAAASINQLPTARRRRDVEHVAAV